MKKTLLIFSVLSFLTGCSFDPTSSHSSVHVAALGQACGGTTVCATGISCSGGYCGGTGAVCGGASDARTQCASGHCNDLCQPASHCPVCGQFP